MESTLTLTPRDLVALKARRDFPVFCRIGYRPYTEPPHLRMLNAALVEVERYIATRGAEGIGRLRIELPPRHGKSVSVARLFPAWMLGRHPNLRIIIASHGAGLSEGHSRFVRNTLRSTTYRTIFPAVALADDSQDRASWDMQEPLLGGLLAVGTGGSVTGRGAGLIICDDLIKSREEVESEAARDKLWDWYTSDLLTRQEPHAAIIHIGTRWHMDDILGRLAMREPGNWHVIRLPALAEADDPLGREPGAALWPDRFDRAAILQQAESMGDYAFSALYQQSPISSAGGVFARDRFNLIDSVARSIREQVRFWDLAISEKKTADYTVGTLIGQTDDGRFVVLDVQRLRLGWQACMDKITQVALADGPATRIGIEKVLFSAAATVQLLQRPELSRHTLRGIEVHKDKLTRALPFAARVDAGLVDVLRRGWTSEFLDELGAFPNGRHDDQVDSACSAYEMVSHPPLLGPVVLSWGDDEAPARRRRWGEV